MNVAEGICDVLVQLGVTTVYGVPGDGNLIIDHAWSSIPGVEYVKAVREDGAVMMAVGHAHAAGSLGVASVTCGPGLTNSVTALTTAVRGRAPLLVLTGELASHDRHHVQAIDQTAVIESTGAAVHRLHHRDTLLADVIAAAQNAIVRRQATVLVVPMTMQTEILRRPPERLDGPVVEAVPPPGADELDAAVGILAGARRTVLLAGRGCDEDARPALLLLAERLGASLGTTLLRKDYFKGETSDLGVVGTLSSPPTAEVLCDADCIMAFGASLTSYTSANGSLFEGAAVVQCDIDPRTSVGGTPVAARVIGDARIVAETMLQMLDELDHVPSAQRRSVVPGATALSDPAVETRRTVPGTVDPGALLRAVDRALPPDRTVVLDGGRFFRTTMKTLETSPPAHLVWTLDFGSIGLGVAAATGAAMALPDKVTVTVVGDGGFMMSLAELNTAVRHDVDLIVIVINDGCYGAEYDKLLARDLDPQLSMFAWPELADVARSLGTHAMTVTNLDEDLAAALDALAHVEGPLLIDVRCDPSLP